MGIAHVVAENLVRIVNEITKKSVIIIVYNNEDDKGW